MHQYTTVALALGVVTILICASITTASTIPLFIQCPQNPLERTDPKIQVICDTIGTMRMASLPEQESKLRKCPSTIISSTTKYCLKKINYCLIKKTSL